MRFSFTDATLLQAGTTITPCARYRERPERPGPVQGIHWINGHLRRGKRRACSWRLGLLIAVAAQQGVQRDACPAWSLMRVGHPLRLGHARRRHRHRLAIMLNEASYGLANLRPRAVGLDAGGVAVRPRHFALMSISNRQRLARHRVQHDPAVRWPASRSRDETLRGRRGGRRERAAVTSGTSPCRSSGRYS